MKRLLVIDSSVSPRSPAMRGWLAAAKEILPTRFDEVEVWGFECDLKAPWLKFKKCNPVTNRWAIQSIFYERWIRRQLRKLPLNYFEETLIQCTGTHIPVCDVRYIHFWSTAYAEAAKMRPQFLRLPLKDQILQYFSRKAESNALKSGNTRDWWCVSRGIAEPIIRDAPAGIQISYLPNSYNPERFNHETRRRHRETMREVLNFRPEEIILAFSAFGHFERKGLRQAAEVIDKLRKRGHPVKLLLLGGRPSAICDFQKTMAEQGVNIDGIKFAGLVDEMEKYLSAADAFFMPSHFEAFSLAEIEAAALGLRLYLTSHPGHEMILREEINGRLLPWNPDGMVDILEEEIFTGRILAPHHEIGEALVPEAFTTAMGRLYDKAIAHKWPTHYRASENPTTPY